MVVVRNLTFVAVLIFGRINHVFAQHETLRLTHGPMLGKPTAHSMSVWGRTSETGQFSVRYGANANRLDQMSKPVTTSIDHDNTNG